MKLLLDTHAFLWWLSDDARLGHRVRRLIAEPGNDVAVSVVVLWEMVVEQRVRKLRFDLEEVLQAVDRGGFALLDISVAHLRALVGLPAHHRDPFDHLLIAQAITEEAVFVSDDRHVPRYAVPAMTCSGVASRLRRP